MIRLIKAQARPPRHRAPTLRGTAFAERAHRSRLTWSGGGDAGLAALAALVVLVVRVFDQTVVERVADLEAFGADEIDAVDGLVDAFAI